MNAIDLLTRTIPTGTWGTLSWLTAAFTLANADNIGSTHDILKIPSGMDLVDWALWVSDPGPGGTTLDIGIKSVDGVNQDDPDYFYALVAAAAAGYTRRVVNNEPLLTAQDMYLRVTVQGTNQNGTFAGRFGLAYVYRGNK